MAAKKNTTPAKAKRVVSANPTQIVWPTDRYGVTSKLQKAITAAAASMYQDPDKLAMVLEVLEIGKAHVEAKFKDNVADAEHKRKAYAERLAVRQVAYDMSNGVTQPEHG